MLREQIAREIGDESVETILYRENSGTLVDPDERWREFTSLAEVPDQPLGGWEELIVYTSKHVHRWVPTGYGNGATTVPRHPAAAREDAERADHPARPSHS
ncbi:hypothetical protein [Halorarius litoreus]|uniref:hypothetical protein n=1 Tax=Halorarius litoreus TaxID=2962676 RepID=UPI0020CCB4A9|nr:hypothetical protein [Halorarius litoreus]